MKRALLSLGAAALFLSLAGAPAGCGGSGSTTSTTASSTSTTTSGGTGGSGGSTSTTGTGGSGTGGSTSTTGTGGSGTGGSGTGGSGTGGGNQFEAQACADAKGVCVGQGECVPAGGTIVGNGPSGCHFDDVPVAECCAPPKAKPSPVTAKAPRSGGPPTITLGGRSIPLLPVGAGVAVRAEKLTEVEADFLRVEYRQIVLVAVRHVQVIQARLERL